MRRQLKILVGLLAVLAAAPAVGGSGEWVTLYAPPFQGPDALGQSVATILNLQLLDQMRVPDAKISHGPDTVGVVVWGRPLERYSHEDAEARAKEMALLAQLVFWGKVYEFGDGAIAQTNLSIPRYKDFRETHPERWELQFHLPDGELKLATDIPQRRYSFRPIVLTEDVIKRYSKPDSIEIHAKNIEGPVIGHIGDEFTLLGIKDDLAEVTSGKVRGWIRLPTLSARHSEAVNFSSGLVRVLRGDWTGATRLLEPIAKDEGSPNELRTDAYLYVGLAAEKQERAGRDYFAAALALSPDARRCVMYAVFGELAELSRQMTSGASAAARGATLERAQRLLDSNKMLFLPTDPWLMSVFLGMQRLAHNQRLADR